MPHYYFVNRACILCATSRLLSKNEKLLIPRLAFYASKTFSKRLSRACRYKSVLFFLSIQLTTILLIFFVGKYVRIRHPKRHICADLVLLLRGYFIFLLLWHHICLAVSIQISITIVLRCKLLKNKPYFVYFLGSIGGIRGLNYDLKVSVQTNE